MECSNRKIIWPHRSIEWTDRNEEKPVSVPCGKCLPCLQNKRNSWSFRIEQEYKHSKSAMFVTLTYDQKHYPSDGSLDKKHLQDFMKRLRKRDGTNTIRYYATGEYGSKAGRAHYHIILFNAQEDHVRQSWVDSKKQPIGMVHIGRVTEASIAYCTKYIVQPELKIHGKQSPFALMSRRYGIGGHYLTDEMVKWHRDNHATYAMRYNEKVNLPRFYQDKIWYNQDREAISARKMSHAIKTQSDAEKKLIRKYGPNWMAKRAQFRQAVERRISRTIKYTQTF